MEYLYPFMTICSLYKNSEEFKKIREKQIKTIPVIKRDALEYRCELFDSATTESERENMQCAFAKLLDNTDRKKKIPFGR